MNKDRLADVDIVIAVGAWRRSPMCSQRPQPWWSDKYVPWCRTCLCPIGRELAGTGTPVRCYAGRAEANRRNRAASR